MMLLQKEIMQERIFMSENKTIFLSKKVFSLLSSKHNQKNMFCQRVSLFYLTVAQRDNPSYYNTNMNEQGPWFLIADALDRRII